MQTVQGRVNIRYALHGALYSSDTECAGAYTYPIRIVEGPIHLRDRV